MTIQTEMESNILGNYPFSLLDIDGSLEMWEKIYNTYIDLIESKVNFSKNESISTIRNHNFAFKNEIQERIADFIILNELEESRSKAVSKSSSNYSNKSIEKIEDQYSDVLEKENYNLNISFFFTNKKIQPLKLIQILKLSDEVKKYSRILHKNQFKQYSKIIPQIIFISLFGYEKSIEDYLRDNLHGKLNRNISIMVVPPIDNKLWNNYLVENSMEDNNNYEKHKWGLTFDDYKTLKKNGSVNQHQVNKMETYYNDLKESKDLSEYNCQQVNTWSNILSINDSSTLLDIKNSRKKIKELVT